MSDSPRDLARDAELSRARLDLAIDQLEDRLTPRGLLDEAVGLARRSVSLPLIDKYIRSLARNPLPVFLIAAGAGLLAWRVLEADVPDDAGRRLPAPGRRPDEQGLPRLTDEPPYMED